MEASQLLVGYPLNDDGSQSRMSFSKKIWRKLKNKFNIPVHFIDERFSSSEADLRLKALKKI